MRNKFKVIAVAHFPGQIMVGTEIPEGSEPSKDTVLVNVTTGEQWRVNGFGHLPAKSHANGLRALVLVPVLHQGKLEEGDELEEMK